MIETGLQGKVALITGANNPLGIGAATARTLSREGAKVFLTYLRLRPEQWGLTEAEAEGATDPGDPLYHQMRMRDADQVVNEIREAGGVAASQEFNLVDTESIPSLFDAVENALGPVNILINNASHYALADTILEISDETIDETFATNVRASVLLIRELARRRRARTQSWGRVVNLSTGPSQCFSGQISYGASKAAIEAFTRSIACELGCDGITVNAVAPGVTQTGYVSPESEKSLLHTIPLGRLGTSQDIADAIVFLCSEQASWITGQVLRVAGGRDM